MSDFYKRFLLEDVPKVMPGTNKQVFLGAFGKHPGWDDHIEDLGLETASLIEAKKLFYVQGIGGEIDAGAWEKLDDSQRLAAFKHVFIWQRPGQYLAGRLWSSSDGKGRTRYPMVICAHCTGVSLTWVLDNILPRLERIEGECVTTQSAAEVRSILDRYRAELRNVASGQTTELGPPSLDTSFITKFAARAELGPGQEGWLRVLYAVQSQFGAFARGKFNPKSVTSTLRPQQIRVPRAADSLPKAILQWSGFFMTQVDSQAPILLTVPLEEQWIDVTVGEPASQELFCLRASPKAMPLASEVPYNFSDGFREQARGVLSMLESGKPPPSIFSGVIAAPAAIEEGTPPARGRFLKWFGAGLALVAVAAILTVVILKQTSDGSLSPQAGSDAMEPATGDLVVTARPPAQSTSPPTPSAIITPSAPDPALAKRQAEESRLAEEKARLDAAARLKAVVDEQEKIRAAAEAEKKRLAEEQKALEARRATQKPAGTAAAPVDAASNPASAKSGDAASPAVTPSVAGVPRTNGIGMIFLPLPGGYWVGKYEVTQAQFEKITGGNPSAIKDPARPVDSVNWEDANDFCRKLTAFEQSSGGTPKGMAYALPTEAQWLEFAADTELSSAVTSQNRTKRGGPEPVGTLPANKFGLHDVRGNVWEWCAGTNNLRVLRGGGFDGFTATGIAPTLAIHYRWLLPPEQRKPQAGFRCLLVKLP